MVTRHKKIIWAQLNKKTQKIQSGDGPQKNYIGTTERKNEKSTGLTCQKN